MKILSLDSIPKMGFGRCSIGACFDKHILAKHTISLPGITHGLCEKHYQQLRDEMVELALMPPDSVGKK